MVRKNTGQSAKKPRQRGRQFSVEPLESRCMLTVVINELHVDPDISTEKVEFIELYNDSSSAADVSNWVIDDAVDFTFTANASIAPFGYYVIAQDSGDFQSKFGVAPNGTWEPGDKLSNDGETIQLRDAAGNVMDEVDYKIGFPWPTVGESGRSMELINPSLENDIGGSWRASGSSSQPEITFLDRADTGWSYRKGTSEASNPIAAWRQPGFTEDASWLAGQTPVGYGDNDDNTVLSDMRSGYWSVYMRNTFDVAAVPNSIELGIYADDGAAVWINGFLAGFTSVSNPTTNDLLYDSSASNHEAQWESFTINNASQFLVTGANTIAVHGLNSSFNSSDFSLDVEVKVPAVTGSDPSPGAPNASSSLTAPPQIRQVNHSPKQPVGGEDVVISMKVTDPDGVQSVSLEYQLVNPGSYVRIDDAAYDTGWTTLPMNDDGTGGDLVAGDDIYSVTIAGSLNTHRRLVRYRASANDTAGALVNVPYVDDPQPNFAYFVYDGVPDYTASLRPGVQGTVAYSGDKLDNMATYHLIANSTDVSNSQWNGSFNEVQFRGTLVYDGEVYDHIEFRNRGQGSTYQVGKNKWKLNFLRGHSFEARDDYGNKYDVPWDKINILPGTNPWWRNDVSTEGTMLYEPVAFKLFDLAGTPSSHTQYFQFRVIDSPNEVASSQYEGDYWGLYIGIEQPDGRFLDERGLPDGNTYNMHGGTFGSTSQRNQAADLPSDRSDLATFVNGVNNSFNTQAEWEQNLDLESYFAWNQINHVVNNSDIRNHENVNYYHNSETGLWEILPWDLDLTFEDRPHWNSIVTVRENIRSVRNYPALELQYDNQLRNLSDLLLDNGDAAAVVDEYSNFLAPGGDLTIPNANQAQWDYHPRKNKKGIWFDNFNSSLLPSQSYAGIEQYMKDYVSPGGYGYDLLDGQGNDSSIPNRPGLAFTGSVNYARDGLSFSTSNFSDPNGNNSFAAMEWRLAEVHNSDVANYDSTKPYIYEIEGTWDSDELTTYDSEMTIPATVVEEGKTYRVRVRMKDTTGRWSHWSEAEEFLATAASTVSSVPLTITEISYNPGDPTTAELAAGITDKDDFEFIELMNAGPNPVSLANVQFEQVLGDGVTFDFSAGAITTLMPGERVVVVENQAAFESRYGTDVPVAGEWAGGLANGDELITLTIGGLIRHQFEYEDGWQPTTDNGGYTLQVVDGTDTMVSNWDLATGWQASSTVDGSPGAPNVVGDFNEDGIVTAADIDMLSAHIESGRDWYSFDLNADNVVNKQDVDEMILNVLGTNYGDANLDGFVDNADFAIWNANRFTGGAGWANADFNCDTYTDVSDFNIWNSNRSVLIAAGIGVVDAANEVTEESVSPKRSLWQNPADALDTNDDGAVSPLDALLVINQINGGGGELSDRSPVIGYVDSNGDGELSPLDALVVVNRLNELASDMFFSQLDEDDDTGR